MLIIVILGDYSSRDTKRENLQVSSVSVSCADSVVL